MVLWWSGFLAADLARSPLRFAQVGFRPAPLRLPLRRSAHAPLTWSVPSIRCGLHIFHWWACVAASGRHFEHLIWSSFTVLCVHFELSD